MNKHVIIASGLVKRFGDTTAVHDIDLTIRAGESLAIMGASGSGKTTLLHLLAGIETPDSGTITLDTNGAPREITRLSEDTRSELRRKRFGFVFQQGLLIPELTAIENVALPLLLDRAPRDAAFGVAAQWMAKVGLAGFEDRRIGQLSGGQAQRVAVARAQVTNASVVFADEPTGSLDSTTSEEIMTTLLESTTTQGRALVVVTHDLGVASRCDRIVRIVDGRIVPDTVPVPGDAVSRGGVS